MGQSPCLTLTNVPTDSSEAFLWMNFSDTQGLEGLQTAAGALDDIDFNKVRISSLEIDGPNKSGACTFPGKLGETAKCELNLNRAKVWLVDKTTGAPVKTQAIKVGKVVVSVVPHPEDPKKWRLAYFDWYIG